MSIVRDDVGKNLVRTRFSYVMENIVQVAEKEIGKSTDAWKG